MSLGSGTGFLKNQTRVRVRVLGLKIFQKTGYGFVCISGKNWR
jgi:hypothetical protein